MKTKIGILGSGVVAQTLGSGFIKHGYEVMMGTRDVSKLAEWQKTNKALAGSFREAAAFGDIVVLAVKGTMAASALALAGAENLSGKVLIDTSNPIADLPPVNGVVQYFSRLDASQMEQLQKEFPEARFVKAFNSVGSGFMINPDFDGIKPSMFICGNDATAKALVTVILDQFGWETEDMGAVEAARAIEPLCMLWCIPGMLRNEWTHAFKLLKK
ncbi:MAG: NAD(P)-binding domain-containing protein [Bacteroidota bacterium]